MKNFEQWTKRLLLGLCLCTLYSCEQETNQLPPTEPQARTCELTLSVPKPSFDSKAKAAGEWQTGDKIFLYFTIESGAVYGDAVYNSSGKWTLNYYGTFTEGGTGTCRAVYVENKVGESGRVVNLNEGSAIYEATDGQYTYSGGNLSVTATLKPKTGRIRFSGTSTDTITLSGIMHYTSYDYSTGKYTTSNQAIKTKIQQGTGTRYTPYMYGAFSDSASPRIIVMMPLEAYTRAMPLASFRAGESGYMNLPTEAAHTGWQNTAIFKVNGVEFTMIPVVMDGKMFLLAETETTNALYAAVMGDGTKDELPYTLHVTGWQTFLNRLNAYTGVLFRFPSKTEWMFAAKGGSQSRNYTYAGSNIIEEVAWYSGNSGGKAHLVKQLRPNELGFYDMSGNVSEYLIDLTSGTYRNYIGGSYNTPSSYCGIRSIIVNSSYNGQEYNGLRIALSL